MFFAGNISHAIPLFVSANVLPFNMLYFEIVCSLMHDMSTNSAPHRICDLITLSSDVHSYNVRFRMLVTYQLINQEWVFDLINKVNAVAWAVWGNYLLERNAFWEGAFRHAYLAKSIKGLSKKYKKGEVAGLELSLSWCIQESHYGSML